MILKRMRLIQSLAAVSCFAVGGAAGAESDATPDDAFLEFLGGFETEDGDWVDPMSLAELDSEETAGAEHETEDEKLRGDEDET